MVPHKVYNFSEKFSKNYFDFHNDPVEAVLLTVFSKNPHGLNEGDIFSPF